MGMTVTEALMEGLKTTVVGLSIVFGVLIILMLVLMLMKVIFYKEPEKAKAPEKKMEAPVVSAPVQAEVDDSELVAVLTAAIAASLNTSTYNLRIKSFRRIDSKANAWNNASIRENINNKTY